MVGLQLPGVYSISTRQSMDCKRSIHNSLTPERGTFRRHPRHPPPRTLDPLRAFLLFCNSSRSPPDAQLQLITTTNMEGMGGMPGGMPDMPVNVPIDDPNADTEW